LKKPLESLGRWFSKKRELAMLWKPANDSTAVQQSWMMPGKQLKRSTFTTKDRRQFEFCRHVGCKADSNHSQCSHSQRERGVLIPQTRIIQCRGHYCSKIAPIPHRQDFPICWPTSWNQSSCTRRNKWFQQQYPQSTQSETRTRRTSSRIWWWHLNRCQWRTAQDSPATWLQTAR
jgi:hypothetical protein